MRRVATSRSLLAAQVTLTSHGACEPLHNPDSCRAIMIQVAAVRIRVIHQAAVSGVMDVQAAKPILSPSSHP